MDAVEAQKRSREYQWWERNERRAGDEETFGPMRGLQTRAGIRGDLRDPAREVVLRPLVGHHRALDAGAGPTRADAAAVRRVQGGWDHPEALRHDARGARVFETVRGADGGGIDESVRVVRG